MKKINVAIFTFFVIIPWMYVDAASMCDYQKLSELKAEASNVKVIYEENSREMNEDEYVVTAESEGSPVPVLEFFDIKLYNITKNMYVKIKNSSNDEIKYIYYKDTDEGNYSLTWNDISEVVSFTYTIYTSDETGCQDEELKNGALTTPMSNPYYDSKDCEENKDFALCKKYITIDVDGNTFQKKLSEYKNKNGKQSQKQEEEQQQGKKNNNLKKYIIAGLPVLIVAGGVTVMVIKKRRSRGI